jgi:hypothetical protein
VLLWRYEALARHVRHEDPEVRSWAASRLLHHYPGNASDLVAPLLLDEASGMGEAVADHLAAHGSASHIPLLERGFRHTSGMVPAACVEALGSLGYPALDELVASSGYRGDLDEPGLAGVVAALLRHCESTTGPDVASRLIRGQPALLADPVVAREVFARVPSSEMGESLSRLREALGWSGAEHAVGALQGILEGLEVDDVGWLLHTDRRNLVELERTVKSFDATYDAEARRCMGGDWLSRFETAFRDGSLPAVAGVLEEFCRERAADLKDDDPLAQRIAALVSGLCEPRMLQDLERMGPGAASQTVVTLLSCALKLASFRPWRRELERAGGDLDRLLELAEVESAALMDQLPAAIVKAAPDDASRSRAIRFAVETLGRRGPWYGRILSLEVLGRLQAVEEAHEVIQCLSDHHEVVVEAAGRSLERMGPGVVGPVRNAYHSHFPEAQALEWMVAAVCQAGTRESLAFILEHMDELVASLDPGFVCDWVSVLGAEELLPVFRDLLDSDVISVGRSLLLVSAIHNRMVPEEERIRSAMEHIHEGDDPDFGGGPHGQPGSGGRYVM